VVISGLSGVDSAMLYLSCPEKERQQQWFAWYEGLGTAGMLAASLLCSLCFGEDYRLAGFWTMVAYGVAMVLSLFLEESPHGVAEEETDGGESLVSVIRAVLGRPKLLWLLFAFGCFQETNQTVTVFLNQLQYERARISLGWLGVLAAGMQVLGFLGIFSGWLAKRVGERRAVLLLMGSGAASCAMLAFTRSPIVSIVGIGLMSLAGSLLSPLKSVVENRQVKSAARATELSVYAMLSDGLAAGINVVFGRAADVSLTSAFWLGAGLCVVACVAYAVQGNRNELENFFRFH
jgi:MFS family permease